jgi:anti-sigma factor RsiW
VTCQEFIDFLMDYDEGLLPTDRRAQFDEHLSVCPDCVNYLASYRVTKALGKSVFPVTSELLPPEVPVELIQAILAARYQNHPSERTRPK